MEQNKVSFFRNIKSVEVINNLPLLQLCTTNDFEDTIKLLRQFEKGSQQYTEIKENLLCFTPSISCTQRGAEYMTSHSGYVCLDFDNVDDPEQLKNELKKLAFVSFCALSCSGQGVYAMVRIDKPNLHVQHYEALILYFNKLGMNPDTSCKNIARLRIVSYDPNYYYNERATVWSDVVLPQPKINNPLPCKYHNTNINESAIYTIRDYVVASGIDITSGRNYWLGIGAFIAQTLGHSTGKSVFRDISQYHPRFNDKDFDKAYASACEFSSTNIGVLLNACKRAGLPDLTRLLSAKT